ncbi:MAG: class I SAM-dependent methyltransferase [Verrucomicrobia bacterium]|nr:class I SAM-dependent methyltransferase [Verrucomicrobiota bacterium]
MAIAQFNVDDYQACNEVRARLLIDDASQLLQNKCVLELAACKGQFTSILARYARSVTAVEANADYISQIDIPNVTLINGDAHHCIWELEKDAYDVVFCAGFIYHTAHPLFLLEGMAYLNPRNILIDSLDPGIAPNGITIRNVAGGVNKSYNRYNELPDCGLALVPGRNLISLAMSQLGYRLRESVDKSAVEEGNNDYLRAWKASTSIWYERNTTHDH